MSVNYGASSGASARGGLGFSLSLPGLTPDQPAFWTVVMVVVLVVAIIAIAHSLR